MACTEHITSVILLEIDFGGVRALKLESYAPRSIDMDGVSRRREPLQGMEVVTGDIHGCRGGGNIQRVKAFSDPFMKLALNFGCSAYLEQLTKPFVLPAPDHGFV
jgi:hypothetical protein